MSVVAGAALAFFALAGYLLWTDPLAAGPLITPDALSPEFWLVVGVLVAGTAWYAGTKVYRRNQGVDIDLAFRQIPIE